MKNITKTWLKEKGACSDGTQWFIEQKETNAIKVLNKLVTEKHLDWANWTVTKLLMHKQQIAYAVFAAEQVLDVYERRHTNEKAPRKAIKIAKLVLKQNTAVNRSAANAAANAANAAAYAANATYVAGAANAAYAAAYAADAAAYAANAAA
jgi:hypothetical protein